MEFEWKLDKQETENNGKAVEGLLTKMDGTLKGEGLPLEGFRFMHSSREMLQVTREIEDEYSRLGKGSTLFVGFQQLDKLERELNRYQQLKKLGVKIIAFGVGKPDLKHLEVVDDWVQIPLSLTMVENQWFLISESENPIAFVGWEVSEDLFAQGKLSDPGKMFNGFISSDIRVVKSLLQHLEALRINQQRGGRDVSSLLNQTDRDIQKILIVTKDSDQEGQGEGNSAFWASSLELCHKLNEEAVLYDISAASYFVNPGPHGSDNNWKGLVSKEKINSIGRANLASNLDRFHKKGITANAILAEKHGFKQIATIVAENNFDIVLVPNYFEYPKLVDRLVGNTIAQIGATTFKSFFMDQGNGTFAPLTGADAAFAKVL